jgi:hypothetical protein
MPRLCLLVVLLCLAALFPQPQIPAAQTMLSPEIQRRIERVCARLTTPVVEKDDPHVCQTLQDRMAADRVPGVSIAVIPEGFATLERWLDANDALTSAPRPG